MELNEMEKKLLFQVEGDYQTKILNELYMTVRYSNNSEQREAAEGLMAKLRVLSNAECMDLVKDIQKNYRLPYPARTIGEKIAEARQQSGAEKLKGHDIMALERFDPEVKHMIVFDVYTINNYISIYLPAILRCFRIAGFLFSKEGCYITQNEVNAVFDEQVRLCADTLKRKTKEYTGDDPDRLGAFKAAAALQHTTPQRALAGMLAKHIVSLYDMCFAEEVVYPMDTWDEKITDSLNYLFLLKAIVKEGHTN